MKAFVLRLTLHHIKWHYFITVCFFSKHVAQVQDSEGHTSTWLTHFLLSFGFEFVTKHSMIATLMAK